MGAVYISKQREVTLGDDSGTPAPPAPPAAPATPVEPAPTQPMTPPSV